MISFSASVYCNSFEQRNIGKIKTQNRAKTRWASFVFIVLQYLIRSCLALNGSATAAVDTDTAAHPETIGYMSYLVVTLLPACYYLAIVLVTLQLLLRSLLLLSASVLLWQCHWFFFFSSSSSVLQRFAAVQASGS